MRLRVTKIDEHQFLLCLKHSLWGSKSSRFKDWREGDYLIFIVDKALAGYASVSGKPFYSKTQVWDNGVFPYRIPIKFSHVIKKDERPPVLGEVRNILTSAWGPSYGWGIITQSVIEGPKAENLMNIIEARTNSIKQFETDLPAMLEETKQKTPLKQEKRGVIHVPPKETLEEKTETNGEISLHLQAEEALIRLGNATGCSVCIAPNDKNKVFQGKPLGEECLRSLPSFGLSEEATKTIRLIDIIWTMRNSPVCAFEVETTTSIYSGLLRMSDLLSVIPSLNIKLYVVAPKEREDRVRFEINRPTFQKIGLNEYCKFIPLEELFKLLSRVEGLHGYIQHTIIDTIATSFEMQDTEEKALH